MPIFHDLYLSRRKLLKYLMRPIILFAGILLSISGFSQQNIVQRLKLPATESGFHGYKQFDFVYKQRSCKVVTPTKPAKGAPLDMEGSLLGPRAANRYDATWFGLSPGVLRCCGVVWQPGSRANLERVLQIDAQRWTR
jgi:hypothetical protein